MSDREFMTHTVAGILAAFLLITTAGAAVGALEWDEGSFLLNAQYFLGSGENFEESRPHAFSYLISGVWSVTGESTFIARLIVVLFGTASILLIHRLASSEFDDPLPVTAAFAFTPLMLYWSFHAYTDVPAMLLVYLGWYFYRADQHLLAGVMLAAATTVRYVFFPFAAGMAVAYLFIYRDRFPRYVLGGIIGAAPFFLYSYMVWGGVFSRIQLYIRQVSEWSGSGLFAATTDSSWSAVLMLSVLIPAAYTGWKQTPTVEKTMVLIYAAFFLFVSGNAFYRYWLPTVPFLLFMAYRGLQDRKQVFGVMAVLMIVASGVAVGGQALEYQQCIEPLEDAVGYVQELDDDGEGTVISDEWAITGYLLDRNVVSPYTDYETLQEEQNAEYVITRDEWDYEELAVFSNQCDTFRVYRLS